MILHPERKVLRDEKRRMTTWDREKKQKAEEKRAIPVDDVDLLRDRGQGEPWRGGLDRAMVHPSLRREGC
jgi:hypothetical protein